MQKDILIIAAMEDVELDYLKSKLNNLKKTEYKGFIFYEGNMARKDVVLCTSKIGLINASICTAIAIEKYNPKIIINEGVSGGYTNEASRGKVVIGLDAINITSVECKDTGNSLKDYEITTFLHNEENKLIPQKADEKLVNFIRENFKKEDFIFGRIASGDIWNKNKDVIKNINQKYGAICEDMECIAIYTVANIYGIPVISIKGISNNEVLGEIYNNGVCKDIQCIVEKFVQKINILSTNG